MCHPAKTRHPAKMGMAAGLGMAGYPKHPAKRQEDGMDGIAGPEGNGYKNVLDFIITLVVVNLLIVHLLPRLILVILP